MAVKLRLRRMGTRQKPFYRIVAADSRFPRDGRFIEALGTYNPLKGEECVEINEEKTLNWLKKGAQPTDTVRNILSRTGIMAKHAGSKAPKAKAEKKSEPVKEVKEEKKTAKKATTTKKATTKKTTTKKSK